MNRLADADLRQESPAQCAGNRLASARNPDVVETAATGTALASAIYTGTVRHRRHAPHAHAFSYRMAMLYLDLAELDQILGPRWLWSNGRRNVAEFRRSDYLGNPDHALDDAVRMRVAETMGRVPEGPIRLLTHLRYFGHSFNPVSFYYCFEADGTTLDVVVAEITNTPWKQRHAYILPVAGAERQAKSLTWRFAKEFHVSPFMAMEHDYHWRLTEPDELLLIHMDVMRREANAKREFDATLTLHRKPVNASSLASTLLRFPLMTTRIVGAIHWQALRLWMCGNPVHDHPDNEKTA
jgi:uncharacterized protein